MIELIKVMESVIINQVIIHNGNEILTNDLLQIASFIEKDESNLNKRTPRVREKRCDSERGQFLVTTFK